MKDLTKNNIIVLFKSLSIFNLWKFFLWSFATSKVYELLYKFLTEWWTRSKDIIITIFYFFFGRTIFTTFKQLNFFKYFVIVFFKFFLVRNSFCVVITIISDDNIGRYELNIVYLVLRRIHILRKIRNNNTERSYTNTLLFKVFYQKGLILVH